MDIITIQNSINKIIQRFCQIPFYYFYEEDIRVDWGSNWLITSEQLNLLIKIL